MVVLSLIKTDFSLHLFLFVAKKAFIFITLGQMDPQHIIPCTHKKRATPFCPRNDFLSRNIFAANINETVTDEAIQSHYGPETVMAVVRRAGVETEYKLSNVPVAEKLEKFMEDVK